MGLAKFSWSTPLIQQLNTDLKTRILDSGVEHGEVWVTIRGKDLKSVVEHLRETPDFAFDSLVDICGVDCLGRSPRFESVVHLYSSEKKIRIRIHCLVPDESMTLPSLTSFWKGANWHERESFDQYGIRYEGHPNLKKILNAPSEKGYPQRKDYALRGDREEDEEL